MDNTINGVKEGRMVSIDILKGVAACLVVLGHIVTAKEEYHWLYNYIYSFHMPLFMFLAGCTAVISYRNRACGGMKYLAKRFVNIILPYLVWTVCLSLAGSRPFGNVDWDEVLTRTFITNRMFWFLPTLYGLLAGYVCYCWIRKFIWNLREWEGADEKAATWINFVSCVCVTGIFVLLMFFTKYQLFRDIVGFTIPFFAAVMYMELKWVYKLFHRHVTLAAALIVFILLIGKFDFDHVSVATSLLRMVLGMCAVVILLRLSGHLSVPGRICRLFVIYGQSSLLIYILHEWVLKYSGLTGIHDFGIVGNLIWYCAVSILVCGVCSVFSKGLLHVPVIRVLFLGKMGGGHAKKG